MAKAFVKTNACVTGIYSRNSITAQKLADACNCPVFRDVNDLAKAADVVFLAVPDYAIASIAEQLNTNAIVVHCSGLTSLLVLQKFEHNGVFWPIQSFSYDIDYDFSKIPICLEANSDENYRILEQLADKVSHKIFAVNSNQRQYLHLSAVFANNFANHMFYVAQQIAQQHQFDFNILKPLILETANKIQQITPQQAQTGPAIRGDVNTINEHLKLLQQMPELRQLYELISVSISKTKNN